MGLGGAGERVGASMDTFLFSPSVEMIATVVMVDTVNMVKLVDMVHGRYGRYCTW